VRGAEPRRWLVAAAGGGDPRPGDLAVELPGSARSLALDEDAWRAVRANSGLWWTVFALDDGRPPRRAATIRCLVRHEPIERVAGSTLYGEAPPLFHFSGNDTPAVR